MPKSSKAIKTIDFQKVCRTCLTERGHLREIHSTKIPRMIENFTNIQVSETDGLPTKICVTCFHLISRLYTFKKNMERSDRILRQHLKQFKPKQFDLIKFDVNEVDIENSEIFIIEAPKENKENNIPLNQCVTINNPPLCDLPMSEQNEDLQNINLNVSNIEGFRNDEPVEIFTDGPPPLIPLVPIKKSANKNAAKNEPKPKPNLEIDLPNDTPPLVPIKPPVNYNILETGTITENKIQYQCNICKAAFTSAEDMTEHKSTCCQQNSFQCNICHKEFKESKKLIKHLKNHMVSKDYECRICGKRYPSPSTLKVHMRTHTGERPFKCPVCSKGFVRWAGVVGHMRTHEDNKPYECDDCGKKFKILSNLERHKLLHSDRLPYCCNFCGKCFSQSDNLQLHIRTYHTNERPYLCSQCGKGFVSSTRLNRHMWSHSGHKPYTCSSCPKAYTNSTDLKKHEQTHLKKGDENFKEIKQYACQLCDLKFQHHCRLMRHMKTHNKSHLCEVCHKSFATGEQITKHFNAKHKITCVLPEGGGDQIFVEYESQEVKIDQTDVQYVEDPLALVKNEIVDIK